LFDDGDLTSRFDWGIPMHLNVPHDQENPEHPGFRVDLDDLKFLAFLNFPDDLDDLVFLAEFRKHAVHFECRYHLNPD
jgi:hypothetical protein